MPGSLPQMLVAILCGGRGTGLQEHRPEVPKPLVEIGGHPILWHVVRIYAAQGFRRFLLLTGYRGEEIEAFARESYWPEGVDVRCVDTGLETPTGGRLWRGRGDPPPAPLPAPPPPRRGRPRHRPRRAARPPRGGRHAGRGDRGAAGAPVRGRAPGRRGPR